jgi:sugar phosphate isomerase/epimerase
MKFAICNELFGDWPWEKGLELARTIGYTGVEVAPFTLGQRADLIASSTLAAYRQCVMNAGMEVLGLHWLLAKTEGFHLTTDDPSIRKRTTDYLRFLVDMCQALGGTIMVLGSPLQRNFPPSMTHPQAVTNAIDTLLPLVPNLEQAGVRIAIEPLGPAEGNFLNTADQAIALIEEIQSPTIQLHLDVKAMSSEELPFETIIRNSKAHLIHFHANDPNKLGPGMGLVDQKPIFQTLRAIDYQNWVSVEAFDYAPGVEEILRASWKGMQDALVL